MYSEGLMDLMEMIMILPFVQDVQAKLENIESKAKTRYFPVFEKVPVVLFGKVFPNRDVNISACLFWFLTNHTAENYGFLKVTDDCTSLNLPRF